MPSDTARLESVETKLAFQEETLQQLSDALIAQQTRIDRLEAQLVLLAEQLRTRGEDGGEPGDQPPPHY